MLTRVPAGLTGALSDGYGTQSKVEINHASDLNGVRAKFCPSEAPLGPLQLPCSTFVCLQMI